MQVATSWGRDSRVPTQKMDVWHKRSLTGASQSILC